ncbi:MAG: hypothetical protein MHM6MM_005937 [Cercozoa sp. M6MM]
MSGTDFASVLSEINTLAVTVANHPDPTTERSMVILRDFANWAKTQLLEGSDIRVDISRQLALHALRSLCRNEAPCYVQATDTLKQDIDDIFMDILVEHTGANDDGIDIDLDDLGLDL